ncbi:MAG: nucleoprotein [Hangzhou rhabdovirus 3]|nr:MAG: nucleoprotein [Hangzhou rhabdovirus 3]
MSSNNKINFDGVPSISTGGLGINSTWDDANNDKLCTSEDSLKSVDLATQKSTMKWFLNAYFSGEVGKASILDMMKLLILHSGLDNKMWLSMLPESANQITLPSGEWKELKDTDFSNYFSDAEVEKEASKTSGLLPGAADANVKEDAGVNVDVDDAKKFYESLLELIDDNTDMPVAAQICQFICLVLIRKVAKTTKSVEQYFSKRFMSTFNNVYSRTVTLKATPPHSKFMELLSNVLQKGTKPATSLIKVILSIYWTNISKPDGDKKILSILSAGCLLHLKYNGMTVVKSILHLSAISSFEVKKILKYSAYKAYESTLAQVVRVFTSYFKENTTSLFPWCRLIDDSYHSGLASDKNKEYLKLIFYAISIIDSNLSSDIFNQHPFNGDSTVPNAVKSWGKMLKDKMVPDYQETLDGEALPVNSHSGHDDSDGEEEDLPA